MTTHFTDREKQVIAMALIHVVPAVRANLTGEHIPLNEFDTIKHSHVLAHIYTALEKVSGKPPASFFQNPNPSQQSK